MDEVSWGGSAALRCYNRHAKEESPEHENKTFKSIRQELGEWCQWKHRRGKNPRKGKCPMLQMSSKLGGECSPRVFTRLYHTK